MKKFIKAYFHCLLSGFKFYRKRKGGKWYKIKEMDVSGFAAGAEFWTQQKPDDPKWSIEIGMEDYSQNQQMRQ
jgi:hypothetical protein